MDNIELMTTVGTQDDANHKSNLQNIESKLEEEVIISFLYI
jgi:hypothetical protein